MLSQSERNQLAGVVSKAAMFFGKMDISKDQISLYITSLDDSFNLNFSEYVKGFSLYTQDKKNTIFPSPASLRKYLFPEQDDDQLAVDVAGRVIEAVSKFGWSNSSEAITYIGELGWKSVNRFGGWQYVCENLGSEISLATFNAQTREMAKSDIYKSKHGIKDEPISIGYKDPDALLNDRKNEQVNQLTNFLKGNNLEVVK